jgi:beta-phosphoglucomutase-like phosphatase (HAD superfamily)
MWTRPGWTRPGPIALGEDVAAIIFFVDGVIIDSARAAAAAWKAVLDPFLCTYALVCGAPFVPFDVCTDYPRYIHGRPRIAGVHRFLWSRGISLPYDDLRGLAGHQEEFFRAQVRVHGVRPFRSTIALIREVRRRGIRTAAVSADSHSTEILRMAGLAGMLDVMLDGLDAAGSRIRAQADSALLAQAARRLGVPPERTAVIDETPAGVTAARRGGFGLVVGVDRTGDSHVLREHGATAVVADLSELRGSVQTPAVR